MKKKLLLVFLAMLLGLNLVSCSNSSKEEVSNTDKEVAEESNSHDTDINLDIDLPKDVVTSEEIDSKISEVQENKEEAAEKKDELKNTVDEIKGQAEGLKGDINTVKDNAEDLKENVSNLKDGINDLKESAEAIKGLLPSKK